MPLKNVNEVNRQEWLKQALSELPGGVWLLDVGAGELKNRKYCGH